jgi:hypothetical protein
MSTTAAPSSRAQFAIGCLIAVFVFAVPVYFQFIRVANEIGPVGMDVDGRKILLQTLSDGSANGSRATSEWEDSNVLVRLIVQEPMRTTFRLRLPENAGTTREDHKSALGGPFTPFDSSTEGIFMTANTKIDGAELNKRLSDLQVGTLAELLAAFGFRRYEVYQGTGLLFAADLPKVGEGNTRIAGWTR